MSKRTVGKDQRGRGSAFRSLFFHDFSTYAVMPGSLFKGNGRLLSLKRSAVTAAHGREEKRGKKRVSAKPGLHLKLRSQKKRRGDKRDLVGGSCWGKNAPKLGRLERKQKELPAILDEKELFYDTKYFSCPCHQREHRERMCVIPQNRVKFSLLPPFEKGGFLPLSVLVL